MKSRLSVGLFVVIALITWFIIALSLQNVMGLADQGDYTRSMGFVTQRPVGFPTNWPLAGSSEWEDRFFEYWLPHWALDFEIVIPRTSAIALWLPGTLANWLVYSKTVLYLPYVSLFSKALLLGLLLLLLRWLGRQGRYGTMLLFGLGIPTVLMLTSTDYVAYLNTFYEESSSLVYLLMLLASIVALRRRRSVEQLIYCLVFIGLLAATKTANMYWPLIAVPPVFWMWWSKSRASLKKVVPACVAATLLLTAFPILVVANSGSNASANQWNRFFNGVLTFSADPSAHLARLGMEDAVDYVGVSAFSPEGMTGRDIYADQLTRGYSVGVMQREPQLLWRMLRHVLDNMQDLSLDYLGKYAAEDPRSQAYPPIVPGQTSETQHERYWSPSGPPFLNLWSMLKYRFFPTGLSLGLVLVAMLVGFAAGTRTTGIRQDLSAVGLLLTVACGAGMVVAILGDGRYELIKHLYLANVLFDLAAIALLNVVFVSCLEVLGSRRARPRPDRSQECDEAASHAARSA